MTDTSEHIKDIQLRIWLSKPPMERLLQFLTDNEALYTFWQQNSDALKNKTTAEISLTAENLFDNDQAITSFG